MTIDASRNRNQRAKLKALLKSHVEGDEERFLAVATQVAAEAARQGHHQAAERPERTKYEELVDILADGLFEMIVDAEAPRRLSRRRRRRAELQTWS